MLRLFEVMGDEAACVGRDGRAVFANAHACGLVADDPCTDHRITAVEGGQDGACGQDWVERADGNIHPLAGSDRAEIAPGDAVVINTPGGGGYGSA